MLADQLEAFGNAGEVGRDETGELGDPGKWHAGGPEVHEDVEKVPAVHQGSGVDLRQARAGSEVGHAPMMPAGPTRHLPTSRTGVTERSDAHALPLDNAPLTAPCR